MPDCIDSELFRSFWLSREYFVNQAQKHDKNLTSPWLAFQKVGFGQGYQLDAQALSF
jgi:hypothetical protein